VPLLGYAVPSSNAWNGKIFASRSLIELGTAKAKIRARRNAQRFLREVCINQLSESLETVPLIDHPRPGNIHPLNRPRAIQLK
jgi:hypothetical protein